MLELNEKIIKKHTGAVTFDRGIRIYMNNDVKELKVEYEKNSTLKVVEGIVYSIEDRKDLRVEILVGMKTDTIEYECQCCDFKDSNKKKACKHIAAVLLRYIKGQPKVVQTQFDIDSIINLNIHKVISNSSEAKPVVEESAAEIAVKEEPKVPVAEPMKEEPKAPVVEPIKEKPKAPVKSLTNLPAKLKLKLGVQFEYINRGNLESASLKLSIGERKLFDIEDIKTFLLSLKHKRPFEISDSFTFSKEKHSFTKEDITLIKLVAAKNQFGIDKYDGSKVYLDKKEIKDFFDIIQSKAFNFIVKDRLYINNRIIRNNLPLEFEVGAEKDKVILKQINALPLSLTEGNEYYFYRGDIYKPDSTQAYRYSSLYKEFSLSGRKEKIYEGEDVEATLALLTFRFKEICRSFKVFAPEKLQEQEVPLEISINVESSDKGIIARPLFKYGGVEIDLFSEKKYINSSKVAKRAIAAERKVIDLIKSFHFAYTRSGFLLSDENNDHVVNFIKNGMAKLAQAAEVTFDDALRNIKIYEAGDYSPEIHFHNSYFEFDLKINGITLKDTREIFEVLNDEEQYYRLLNGDYISLKNKELIRIADIIGSREIEGNSLSKGHFTVSRQVSVLTGRDFGRDAGVKSARNWSEEEELRKRQAENERVYEEKNKKLKDIMVNMERAQKEDYNVPHKLNSIMRNYQKIGFKWFKTLAVQRLGGILADEMGLGKTLQAIALILSDREENKENKKPTLVVAPTSLVYNWENEIQKFAPELNTIVVYGTQKERRELLEKLEDTDVIITTYQLMAKDVDEYRNIEFRYCFIDEAQQIKNARTLAARAVKTVNAEARFALTGTPIENSLIELWSIFDFVMPGYLLSHRSFKEHYELPIMSHGDSKALENLNNIVRPFILRRLKNEVMYELPPKTEQKLIIEMTEEQKEAYFDFLGFSKQSLDEEIRSKGFNRSQINILSVLTKLRQLCCHPAIIMPDYTGESGKMLALDSIIEESILNNHRILLFSQFVSVLQILKKRFEQNGIECLYLDGSTKGQERIRLVEEFNSGKGSVFLISLKAGGFGLNLTGADVVIHFDPWWNPAVEEQATDRAHRIGQTKNVEVIKLITKGSIEEKIIKLHERKRTIAESIISGKDSENSFISRLSQEEIEELFS